MLDKWRKFSYSAQKKRRHRIWWILFWFFVFFAAYNVFTSLIFSVRVLENETMRPGLQKGDRFIFSSYKIYSLLPGSGIAGFPRRGNIVLVDKALEEEPGVFALALDSVIRFFTAQRLGLFTGEENLFIKRVIGLPGDEISMTNFVMRVP